MKTINSLLRTKWFQLFATLVLAIVLFVYVTGTIGNVRGNRNRQNQLITTQTADLNVPLNAIINDNKYYLSGVPQSVRVNITGPSGLVTAAQNSRTIRATVNLRNPKIGSQRVTVRLTGLSDTLVTKLDPSTLAVNVSRKVSKMVPIISTYNRDNIASRYVVSGFKVSQRRARVVGPSDLVKIVDHLSTNLDVPANTQSSITRNVPLKAVDRNGSVVSVEINPGTVIATLDVTSQYAVNNSTRETKTVSLNPTFTGSRAISTYNVTLSTSSVQITGDRSVIDRIDSIPITVNVNKVSNTGGVLTIRLPLPKGVTEISPRIVEVTLTSRSANSSSGGN